MHALLVVHDRVVVQLVMAARAHQKIGHVVKIVVGRNIGGAAKLAAINVGTIDRIEVVNGGADALILVSGFQAVAAQKLGKFTLGLITKGFWN